MTEIWKDVVGYEGVYQVSSRGRVMRVAGGKGAVPGRVLRTRKHSGGYLQVTLCHECKPRPEYVHRLVAGAFLERPSPDHSEVNHRNGNKMDNRVENLEWCTPSENQRHSAQILGNMPLPPDSRGEKNSQAILVEYQATRIRRLYASGKWLQRELADMFGVARPTISNIIRRKTWKHVP